LFGLLGVIFLEEKKRSRVFALLSLNQKKLISALVITAFSYLFFVWSFRDNLLGGKEEE